MAFSDVFSGWCSWLSWLERLVVAQKVVGSSPIEHIHLSPVVFSRVFSKITGFFLLFGKLSGGQWKNMDGG